MAMLQQSTVDGTGTLKYVTPDQPNIYPYPTTTTALPKPPVAPTLATPTTAPTPQPATQPASAPVTSVLPPPPITAQPVSLTPPPVTLPPVTPAPAPVTPPPVTTAPPGAPIQLSDTTLPPPVTLPSPPATPPAPTADGANVPGAAVAPFGPGEDLRFDSILPTAVDRLGLANQHFDQFQEATNPAYEQTLRAATQRAAANGILGSGMLTNTYGDVATQRAQALDLARRGFLTDALQGTIADNAANRDELRTERGYQDQTAQQAVQDQITQLLLQDQLGGNAFNRQLDLAQLLGQLGYAGNPDEALLTGASQQQQQADQTYALLGQLLGQLGQRR